MDKRKRTVMTKSLDFVPEEVLNVFTKTEGRTRERAVLRNKAVSL